MAVQKHVLDVGTGHEGRYTGGWDGRDGSGSGVVTNNDRVGIQSGRRREVWRGGGMGADLLILRGLVFRCFSERAMGANETKRWKEEVTEDRW